MKKIIPALFLIISFFNTTNVFAHHGRTAADGCHYCRTNCDSWGVPWNQRHCHGGTASKYKPPAPVVIPEPVYDPEPITEPEPEPKPTCPWNSTYNYALHKCLCDSGYVVSVDNNGCKKLPNNAHKVNSLTKAWECDEGYEQDGNECELIVEVNFTDEEIAETSEIEDALKIEKVTAKASSDKKGDDTVAGILTLAFLGGGGYYLYRRVKNKKGIN